MNIPLNILKLKDIIDNIKNIHPVLLMLLSLMLTGIFIIIIYCGTNLGKLNEHPGRKWFLRIMLILSFIFSIMMLFKNCNCRYIKSDSLYIIGILFIIVIILIILRFYFEFATDAISPHMFSGLIYIILQLLSVITSLFATGLIIVSGVMILANEKLFPNLILLIIGVVIVIIHVVLLIIASKKEKNDASI